jgi:hypothetical protein
MALMSHGSTAVTAAESGRELYIPNATPKELIEVEILKPRAGSTVRHRVRRIFTISHAAALCAREGDGRTLKTIILDKKTAHMLIESAAKAGDNIASNLDRRVLFIDVASAAALADCEVRWQVSRGMIAGVHLRVPANVEDHNMFWTNQAMGMSRDPDTLQDRARAFVGAAVKLQRWAKDVIARRRSAEELKRAVEELERVAVSMQNLWRDRR